MLCNLRQRKGCTSTNLLFPGNAFLVFYVIIEDELVNFMHKRCFKVSNKQEVHS
jgi:hypothetical protein